MFNIFFSKKTKGFQEKEYLIIHGAHHKAGTNWFNRILHKIANKYSWRYEIGTRLKRYPEADTNIFLHYQSNFDFSRIGAYRGTHLVRDPRDMVVSGYFYHLWCNEEWCKKPVDDLDGSSYQEMLNQLDQDEGIQFEMASGYGPFQRTMYRMSEWNYEDPLIMELRLEELADNPALFSDIFDFYGFNKKEKKVALQIAYDNTFEKITGRRAGIEDKNHHFRKGVPGDWRNYFTTSHKVWFKEHYQGLLEKLGYEQDLNW